MADSSEELIRHARDADCSALAERLERHLPALRALLHGRASALILRRESDSDLVQEVCLEALRAPLGSESMSEGAFRGWLHTIAIRKLVERDRYWRAQARDAGRTESIHDPHALRDRGRPTPSEALIGFEVGERLLGCLDDLTDEQREVLLLSRLAGMSHAEISVASGRSEVAVRSLLSRALGRVAARLDRNPGVNATDSAECAPHARRPSHQSPEERYGAQPGGGPT